MNEPTVKQQRPKLELRMNVPTIVTFETESGKAREYVSEQYGTKSYLYFLKEGMVEKVWYATEKIQSELIHAGMQPGIEYKIVKEDVPGKKYHLFWIYDAVTGEKLNGKAAKAEPPVKNELEEYLAPDDNYSDEVLAESDKMIQKTVKTITDKGTTVGWAIKCALQSMGPIVHEKEGYNGLMKEIKVRAKELMKAHQELMIN